MSIIKRNQIDSFKVDGETTINRYNYSTDTYDIVQATFNGPHGIVMNKKICHSELVEESQPY